MGWSIIWCRKCRQVVRVYRDDEDGDYSRKVERSEWKAKPVPVPGCACHDQGEMFGRRPAMACQEELW